MKMRYLFLIYLFTFSPGLLSACATCYGAPDAPATQGLNMAILVMLGVISSILFISGQRIQRILILGLIQINDNGIYSM